MWCVSSITKSCACIECRSLVAWGPENNPLPSKTWVRQIKELLIYYLKGGLGWQSAYLDAEFWVLDTEHKLSMGDMCLKFQLLGGADRGLWVWDQPGIQETVSHNSNNNHQTKTKPLDGYSGSLHFLPYLFLRQFLGGGGRSNPGSLHTRQTLCHWAKCPGSWPPEK